MIGMNSFLEQNLAEVGFEKDMLERLLNGKTDKKFTLGVLLRIKSRWDLTKLVIDGTENINGVCDNFGYTPLIVAVTEGHERAIEYLLKKGAQVNCENVRGETPLHFVPNLKIAAMLLVAGANPRALDSKGKTPIDNARYLPHLVALMLSF